MSLFRKNAVRKHGIMRNEPVDGTLCEGCDASCCRGFVSVELTADEYGLLKKIGGCRLEFTLTEKYFLIIENGCDFLVANRCSIYDQRPEICRRFTCSDDERSGFSMRSDR